MVTPQMQRGRKTSLYGRAAQESLNNIKKVLENKIRKEREEVVKVAPELQTIGFNEEEIIKSEFLFSSDIISKDYSLHSLILGLGEKR